MTDPPLSRAADINVCTMCGFDEAMLAMEGAEPVGPELWPVGWLSDVIRARCDVPPKAAGWREELSATGSAAA